MCGITGVLYPQPAMGANQLSSMVCEMNNVLIHRGPDDHGVWVDEKVGIGLGHRRLSIVDLSPTGHQPMTSASGRFVIVFNGEIYNFREIRATLKKQGVSFKGNSDTEVLLESIALRGLEKTLNDSNGMFAFALWDKERRTLTLARDRIGKKPLYYGRCNNVFLFGSELKALKTHPDFNDEVDRGALGQFIQFSWLSGPSSIYTDIKKLPAGTYLEVSQESFLQSNEPKTYWSAMSVAQYGVANRFSGSFEDAVDQLEALLTDSVSHRMIADVELGALLSGGIDSSLVVSMMQTRADRKVKTFSIGFHEATHNEAEHAMKIANHLGTDHTELYVTPQECMDVIPKLPQMYDEPFGDVSQIPTYLVSKLAHEKVKVVLSGDGGDELFTGYTRYFRCMDHWKKHERVPLSLRPAIGQSMDASANILWSLLGSTKTNAEVRGWRRFGAKLEKRARRIDAKNPTELFARMMARCKDVGEIVLQYDQPESYLSRQQHWSNFEEPILNMMLMDTLCYLPDDILVKIDRASMATSLEARCPLLDKNVIEFAWQLPFAMKVDEAGGKRILKSLLARYLPTELTDRKKMGFGVPIGKWLRGPLKEWANESARSSQD